MNNEPTTLQTGKYNIELTDGATNIFTEREDGTKEWVASAIDPNLAMQIVEGLILVEHKRFYHPESTPKISSTNDKPVPPFLR